MNRQTRRILERTDEQACRLRLEQARHEHLVGIGGAVERARSRSVIRSRFCFKQRVAAAFSLGEVLADFRFLIIGHELLTHIDRLAPTHIGIPSGARIAIDYETDGDPILRTRLQEMFGLSATPLIAQGRARLRIELLSPARRPLAVTQDLASFWANAYPEVRAEMRGRYPKHRWPENPLAAPPVKPGKLR